MHHTPPTASKILSHYKTLGTLFSASCPGRPLKVSPRDKQDLLHISLHEQFCSGTQVLDSASLQVSGQITPSCANQIFQKAGLFTCQPRMKPFLSYVYRERRLAQAMGHKDQGLETWRDHIFTDESTFETGKPDGSILVWHHSGEVYNEDCICPTFKSGHSTSSHWGGDSLFREVRANLPPQ